MFTKFYENLCREFISCLRKNGYYFRENGNCVIRVKNVIFVTIQPFYDMKSVAQLFESFLKDKLNAEINVKSNLPFYMWSPFTIENEVISMCYNKTDDLNCVYQIKVKCNNWKLFGKSDDLNMISPIASLMEH